MATKQWVRLVGGAHGAALTLEQMVYTNSFGSYKVKPLLRITMNIGQHVPLQFQPENYIFLPDWVQMPGYSVKPHELSMYADAPPDNLWGLGDRVADTAIRTGIFEVQQSLYLLKVDDLALHRREDGKQRVIFTYNEIEYDLSGTDPNYDSYEDGRLVPNGYLCISLGEEFHGYHYKIVATIFGDKAI
jgi:hypothetical protein